VVPSVICVGEGYIAEMSRTRLRVVLILLALILVMATILSGILTYWVGAVESPAPTPEDGEAGRVLLIADLASKGSRQIEWPSCQSPKTSFFAGQGGLCQKAEK
jgi:hypothetical protein